MFLCGSKITFSVRYKERSKKGYLKKIYQNQFDCLNSYFNRNEQQNTCLIQRSAVPNLYSYCTKFVDIYHIYHYYIILQLKICQRCICLLSRNDPNFRKTKKGGKSFERMNDVVLSDADSPDKFLRYASTRNTTR